MRHWQRSFRREGEARKPSPRGKDSPRHGMPGSTDNGRFLVVVGSVRGFVVVRGSVVVESDTVLSCWVTRFVTSMMQWIRRRGGSFTLVEREAPGPDLRTVLLRPVAWLGYPDHASNPRRSRHAD